MSTTTTDPRDQPLVARIGATARTTESRALLVASAAFVLAFLVALLGVGGQSLPISGAWSLGAWAAAVAAVASAAAFVVGYLLPSPGATRRDRPEHSTGRLVLDIVALALAHGFTTLLLLEGVSIVVAQAFLGAVVFPFSSMLLIGACAAMAAYVSFLSAAGMTTARVATVLAVYLVVGVFAAMLSTSDAEWWEKNISALGIGDDFSSWVFNITLIVAGAVITAIASYLTVELDASGMARAPRDADDRHEARRIRLMRGALMALGVFLTLVGVFPVNWIEWVHNTFATGLVVIFAAMVIGLRRLVPRMPAVFVVIGYVFLGVVLVASVFFALGIYNLTAVEIIGFALIFTWLIVLIRNISAGAHDSGADASARP
jgi:hypothetical membrane protein